MTRRAVKRALLAAAIGATVLTIPGSAGAQSIGVPRVEHRRPRSVLYALFGAITGAGAGASYIFTQGQSEPGTCGSASCVVTVTVGVGGLIGYIIGREYDQLHALQYRGGAPLHPPMVTTQLAGEPVVLAARDSTVLVGGSAGVQLIRSGVGLSAVGQRAGGVRGIVALDMAPSGGPLAVGSVSGLYLYPPTKGPGTLVREGNVGAVAMSSTAVYFGAGTRIEVAPLRADTTRVWPGVELGSPVRDLELDSRGLLWVVTDSQLVSLRITGDSLTRAGSAMLDFTARRLAIDGTRAVIAAGERGLRLFDISDPAAPRRTGTWTTAHFAYDVSLVGSRLYVAAGPEGVYLLDVSTSVPTTIGLVHELGFAATLLSHGGSTYVIDRGRTNMLHRIPSEFQD
ncbi:MAG: hypothetical protein ACR2OG_03130 [Gemmatimonadaceae bacterium]